MTPNLEVFDDGEALAAAAAERFISAAREAIALRSRFLVALAGGSTPERLYERLALPENVPRVPWPRTFVFFGDERFVPHDHPDSNVGLARRRLLEKVPVPPGQVFPIPTDLATPEEAAGAYEQVLREQLGDKAFDLILLGMGSDGHTASLFPGQKTLQEKKKWAVAALPGELPPAVPRVTLTFPLLNKARRVLFLVAGDSKRTMLSTWLSGEGALSSLPASGVEGNVTIFADNAAAGDRREG
jgi:6-phosphogluconolactonase